MDNLLEIFNVNKKYGEKQVLKDVSFSIKKGNILGLIGTNGAGKTTLISILAGLISSYEGKIKINGTTPQEARKKAYIGYVPQDMAFYPELSALDNLMFWGGISGLSGKQLKVKAEEMLKVTNLYERRKEPVKNFSGGMKRRLNIVCSLMNKPKLLLLDEPTVGIDVQAKAEIMDMIKRISKQDDISIIFTSHQMHDIENIADEVAIIDEGKILEFGKVNDLIKKINFKLLSEIKGDFDKECGIEIIKEFNGKAIVCEDGLMEVSLNDEKQLLDLLSVFFKKKIQLNNILLKKPDLETLFLEITGRRLRE